ncbi:hypothetical protein HN51_065546 [Arachis hypogaea]
MIMGIWHYVHKERYMFELRNKVRRDFSDIPPSHSCMSSIHSVLVFVSIKLIQNLKAFIHLDEPEVNFIDMATQRSVMHMLGEAEVVAQLNSPFLNKIVVNYAYTFLRKNFLQGNQLMAIPRKRLLKIGMTYEI